MMYRLWPVQAILCGFTSSLGNQGILAYQFDGPSRSWDAAL
jgi:hypothetical protein